MGPIFYKQVLPQIITFFFVNPQTRNIEGMFKECKLKNTLSLMRDCNTELWKDIDNNELAKSLINASKQIAQEEYEAAKFVLDSMIDYDCWLTSEDKVGTSTIETENKEVVTDVIYC